MNARLLARRATLPVVLCVAGLALSGCGQVSRIDEAARDNGDVITQDDVATATRELRAMPQFSNVTRSQVAKTLAVGLLAEPIAARQGRAISDSMLTSQMPALKQVSQPTRDTLRANAVLQTNGQGDNPTFGKELSQAINTAKIELNPQYGAVDRSDPSGVTFKDPVVPWLKAVSLADKAAAGQE